MDDFLVQNALTREVITPAGFAYDAGSKTATLTFAGVLPDAPYEATVFAAGVTHELGEPLPADYIYNFFTLTADGNHDGHVNLIDFNILAGNFNQMNRDASQGDYNYDGIVNLLDFNLLSARFNTTLAAPVPLQPSNGSSVSAWAVQRQRAASHVDYSMTGRESTTWPKAWPARWSDASAPKRCKSRIFGNVFRG